MNQNNTELLHYKRGMYYINKLINIFPDGVYNKEAEKEFVEKETIRWKNNDIAIFDLNNFKFLCTIALMGLNKETIEKENKNKNYKYKINYDLIESKKNPSWVLNYLKTFNDTRTIKSNYDDWLSISYINAIDNFDYNYLFNVRNSLMHSEYNFELYDYHGPYIANLTNSNYSGFCAKIHIPKYYEFMKTYFSNDNYFGLVSNFYALKIFDDKANINNHNELLEFITNKIKVVKLEYDNKLIANKIYEKTVLLNKEITEYEREKYNLNEIAVNLSDDHIKQIIYSIERCYGERYYQLSKEQKIRIVLASIKYALDPKTIISSWILHFYTLTVFIPLGIYNEDDFVSTFAMEDSLLLLKSYLILYRLQNKELQKNIIDYNLINEINFDYELDEFNKYKLKLFNKGIIVTEEEYKIRYFIEIFRNSLAHGNVKVLYKQDNDKMTKQIQLTDEWKNKNRNIILSISELSKFLSSDCFDPKHLNESIVKVAKKR